VARLRDDAAPSWIVFDAKYRSGRSNLLDAMASAHIYRDSLRWDAVAPQFAVLLVPEGADCAVLTSTDYLERNDVGAAEMKPMCDNPGPERLLQAWISGRRAAAHDRQVNDAEYRFGH
jgi:hypothetical protein